MSDEPYEFHLIKTDDDRRAPLAATCNFFVDILLLFMKNHGPNDLD